MNRVTPHPSWAALAVLGAGALGIAALSRGETISALCLIVAAVPACLIAYRRYRARQLTKPDATWMTPI